MADETETKTTATKASDAKAAAKTEAVQRGVDAWVDEHLRNSLFSQDTAAWNHFNERLPALVEQIAKEV